MVHEDESKEDLPAHFVDADAAVVQPVEQLFELEVVEPQRLVDSNSDTAAERRSGDDEYTFEANNADDSADELATTYSGNVLPQDPPAGPPMAPRNSVAERASWQDNAEDPHAAAARERAERIRRQRKSAQLATPEPAEQRQDVDAAVPAADAATTAVKPRLLGPAIQKCMAVICLLSLGWIAWLFAWSLGMI